MLYQKFSLFFVLLSAFYFSSASTISLPFTRSLAKKEMPQEWIQEFDAIKQIDNLEKKLMLLFIFSIDLLKDDTYTFEEKKDFFENVEKHTKAAMLLYQTKLIAENPETRSLGIEMQLSSPTDLLNEKVLQLLDDYIEKMKHESIKSEKSNTPWLWILATFSSTALISTLINTYLSKGLMRKDEAMELVNFTPEKEKTPKQIK